MSLVTHLPGRARRLLLIGDDKRYRPRLSESQLSIALQQSRAVGMAIELVMERLRLSREMALEILGREARAKGQRVSQLAQELLARMNA